MRWNPHGRFFAIAGFGNLPGDVVFYDRKSDGKCKSMGATRWDPLFKFFCLVCAERLCCRVVKTSCSRAQPLAMFCHSRRLKPPTEKLGCGLVQVQIVMWCTASTV